MTQRQIQPPAMEPLPKREAPLITSAPKLGGPKKLRRKKVVSPAQRSRTARANAKKATRDEQGRFASKDIFTHVFDGIEKAVTGVKKAHKTVKRVHRKVKRAFRQQPRMVPVTQRRRRRRTPRRAASQATRQVQQQPRQGGLWRAVSHLLGI